MHKSYIHLKSKYFLFRLHIPKHNDQKLILLLIQYHTATINNKYFGFCCDVTSIGVFCCDVTSIGIFCCDVTSIGVFCCDVTSRGLPGILCRLNLKTTQFSGQFGNISSVYVTSHPIKFQSSLTPL